VSTSVPVPVQRGLALFISLLLMLSAFAVAPPRAGAVVTELFFSEYVEGSSNNKALEIYNGTGAAVDLAAGGYNVQMFFNGSSSAGLTISLTGTVADGDVYVLAQSSADPAILAQADQTNGAGWFNGDDAVVLRKDTTVVDVIGQIGFDPGEQWGADLVSTEDNTLRRKPSIMAGDPVGTDAFDPAVEWDGYAQNTFDGLGFHAVEGGEQPVVVSCGGPISLLEGQSAIRTITATDADGTVTAIEIESVTPADPGTVTIGATTPAATVGGTASAELSIGATTPAGSYVATMLATNDESETGSCTLSVNVLEVLTVGEVQGQTLDSEDGRADRSAYAPPSGNGNGQTVAVRGVVTQRLRFATSSGGTNYGFFLQDTIAAADGDPLTSDGIFVFHSRFTTLLREGTGSYFPEVGDQVVLRGPVAEFFNLTQLVNPRLVAEELDKGVNIATEVETTVADPPPALADAYRYWERLEGMLVTVPDGSVVTGSRDVFASTFDGEVWVIRGDDPLAQRADPYARRVFRDPHPLDDIGPAGSFDNGNGTRILLVSHGLKWNEASNETLIAPARTFDSVQNEVTGGLYFSFGKYGIEVQQQLDLEPGVDPSANGAPVEPNRAAEYSTAVYNVENLYDFRDDPFDGCDFVGNTGCPGVFPPFNYVPASNAAYQQQLVDLADQIANDLHGPDILLVQEAEDQDICTVDGDALVCGSIDDADGKPDTLQELALALAAHGLPYDAAYDRDGADDRGIVNGFLYRTDRVELLEADAAHPVLGSDPQVAYDGAALAYNADVQNPKALNAELPAGTPGPIDGCDVPDVDCVFTRDAQVGWFRVWRDGIGTSVFTDLYAISNHFSSGPDNRVGQRTEQANYNAAIVQALGEAQDGSRVIVGGDFNVFPRPDDPFPPPGTSDQLAALYEIGLNDLWEVVVEEAPSSAYSYVFEGMAQTLDNQFTTDELYGELNGVRFAHVNADWPASYDGDGSRGASDHDPQAARFGTLPTLERLLDLVDYYLETGQIGPKGIGEAIKARIEAVLAARTERAAAAQLRELERYLEARTPRFIDPVASAALLAELQLLLDGS